jgi:hypothetical protein
MIAFLLQDEGILKACEKGLTIQAAKELFRDCYVNGEKCITQVDFISRRFNMYKSQDCLEDSPIKSRFCADFSYVTLAFILYSGLSQSEFCITSAIILHAARTSSLSM